MPLKVWMRHIRKALPLLLLAIFWIAQVQGSVHAISHLGGDAGHSKPALVAQSGPCGECAALSQAGAAPILAPPNACGLPLSTELPASPVVLSVAAAPRAFYRSRAPPFSPI